MACLDGQKLSSILTDLSITILLPDEATMKTRESACYFPCTLPATITLAILRRSAIINETINK